MELSEELVKRRSKHFDLSCVTLLDLSHAGIGRLALLDKCANAVEINLEANQLRSLDGFPTLAALRSLNLRSNQLSSIDDLPPCPALEELSIAMNEIASVDLRALAAKLPRLRSLHLQDNPVAATDGFVARVCSALPNLLLLDGEAVALMMPGATAPKPQHEEQLDELSTHSGASFIPQATHVVSDADAFIAQHTKKIDDLLKQCRETLESETARVLKAFNVASVS